MNSYLLFITLNWHQLNFKGTDHYQLPMIQMHVEEISSHGKRGMRAGLSLVDCPTDLPIFDLTYGSVDRPHEGSVPFLICFSVISQSQSNWIVNISADLLVFHTYTGRR